MSRQESKTKRGKFLLRSMTATQIGDAQCLDAVAIQKDEKHLVRLFFKQGTSVDGLRISEPPTPPIVQNMGGAPVIDLANDEGRDTVAITAGTVEHSLRINPDETGLFAGQNVIFAVRNGETVDTALQWLAYHVAKQQMQGALIFDRARPAESEAFFKALKKRAKNIEGLQRVVVLHADVPLGKPDLPDEAHPFNVPGAPGKDRMDMPPADPWTSPLGEFLIYEIARARFLARARAVANIELYDLIMPSDDAIAFDRAVAARSGCIRLEGVQAFPWRLRKGTAGSFADHICTPFDQTGVRRRWCVAPERAGADTVWRLIRVVGAEPEVDEGLRFYRFMALRHPTESVSKIVPKTSLVENERLLTLSLDHFKWKPVRVPQEEFVQPSEAEPTTTIVTTMKNEGPFILEWLAYHRMIGVDNFLIYTNDCTDGTDTMLQMLQEKGLVQHRENPFRNTTLPPQHAALQAAEHEKIVRDADWLICMDVDEFINIKIGAGHLADLRDAVGDANMISMTWRLFGNNDVHAFSDRLITEQFTRCAEEVTRKPHQAWGFKTLFRNTGIFKKLGVHRPKGLKPQLWENIHWVNGSGKLIPPNMFRNGWRSTLTTYGYDLVQLNHYAVRSAESYLVKRDRGRVNHVDRDQGLSYWFRMNNNAEEERSIQRMIEPLREELAKLLADPDIAAAHEHAVKKHREKIDELQTQDQFVALYEELTSPRLEKLSRMHAHFGANVFLSGPGVIPDEIAQKDPSDEFWFTVKRTETTH